MRAEVHCIQSLDLTKDEAKVLAQQFGCVTEERVSNAATRFDESVAKATNVASATCRQPRAGYKSWACVLRHMKMFKRRPPPVHERLSISAWQVIVDTRKYPDPDGLNYFLAVCHTVTRIEAVQKSIFELDASVATATETRRKQQSEFVTLIASIAAATELLKLAASAKHVEVGNVSDIYKDEGVPLVECTLLAAEHAVFNCAPATSAATEAELAAQLLL